MLSEIDNFDSTRGKFWGVKNPSYTRFDASFSFVDRIEVDDEVFQLLYMFLLIVHGAFRSIIAT